MLNRELLRQQIITDMDHLHDLILRYAAGDMLVKQERDQLEGVVDVKLAVLWQAGNDISEIISENQSVPFPNQHFAQTIFPLLRHSPAESTLFGNPATY